jgi:hypothetical protein
VGCGAYKDQIAILSGIISDLRVQNRELHDRNLAMAGDAADRYHRLKLTEQAHLNTGVIDGIIPRNEAAVDDDVILDEFMSGFTGGFMS